jgi:hypothetical protein
MLVFASKRGLMILDNVYIHIYPSYLYLLLSFNSSPAHPLPFLKLLSILYDAKFFCLNFFLLKCFFYTTCNSKRTNNKQSMNAIYTTPIQCYIIILQSLLFKSSLLLHLEGLQSASVWPSAAQKKKSKKKVRKSSSSS